MAQANPQVPTLTLNSGDQLPQLGLGLWKMPKDTCANIVYEAIKNGYRLLDNACDYGNEKEVGQGIKRAIDEGIVTRQDLFIVSKLWNTFHRPEHVKPACQKTLSDLGLDYVDLYLIHFPIALQYVSPEERYPPEWKCMDQSLNGGAADGKMVLDTGVTYQQTWQAVEALHTEGLCRNIGFCNIGTQAIRQVLNYATVKPAVLQVEMHPYLVQSKLLRMAKEAGLQVMAFSNLAGTSYVELNMATATESPCNLESITTIATRHSRTPAQILLRWAVQRGTVAIPKSSQISRVIENITLFDFELSEEEMNTITALDKGIRYNDPGNFCEPAFGTFCPIYD